jgi:hypothetical protein
MCGRPQPIFFLYEVPTRYEAASNKSSSAALYSSERQEVLTKRLSTPCDTSTFADKGLSDHICQDQQLTSLVELWKRLRSVPRGEHIRLVKAAEEFASAAMAAENSSWRRCALQSVIRELDRQHAALATRLSRERRACPQTLAVRHQVVMLKRRLFAVKQVLPGEDETKSYHGTQKGIECEQSYDPSPRREQETMPICSASDGYLLDWLQGFKFCSGQHTRRGGGLHNDKGSSVDMERGVREAPAVGKEDLFKSLRELAFCSHTAEKRKEKRRQHGGEEQGCKMLGFMPKRPRPFSSLTTRATTRTQKRQFAALKCASSRESKVTKTRTKDRLAAIARRDKCGSVDASRAGSEVLRRGGQEAGVQISCFFVSKRSRVSRAVGARDCPKGRESQALLRDAPFRRDEKVASGGERTGASGGKAGARANSLSSVSHVLRSRFFVVPEQSGGYSNGARQMMK